MRVILSRPHPAKMNTSTKITISTLGGLLAGLCENTASKSLRDLRAALAAMLG